MASAIEHHRAQARRRLQLKRVSLKTIQDIRKDLDLTHKQVANGLGLKKWQVTNMLRGNLAIRPWDLVLLEEIFGMGPGELVKDIRRREHRLERRVKASR